MALLERVAVTVAVAVVTIAYLEIRTEGSRDLKLTPSLLPGYWPRHWALEGEPTLRAFLLNLMVLSAPCSKNNMLHGHQVPSSPLSLSFHSLSDPDELFTLVLVEGPPNTALSNQQSPRLMIKR